MSCTTFSSMGLDTRLWKATAKMGFSRPTLIQKHAIPIALTGADVLLRAKTGSGKSIAFLIPAIQSMFNLQAQQVNCCVMILAPTRDLCKQLSKVATALLHFSYDQAAVHNLESGNVTDHQALGDDLSHVLIGTPGRALAFMQLNPSINLTMLVVDEADLIMSFGYATELHDLIALLPNRALQTMLVSATLNPELDALKALILRNPVTVKLNDDEAAAEDTLKQMYIKSPFEDRYMVILALLKLGPITGKTLFFVADINAAFKLKLFLEAFSIRSAVLNAELPINSRTEIIQSFNSGLIDYLIATDDSIDDEMAMPIVPDNAPKSKSSKKKAAPSNFNAARGIDFVNVVNVINFDMPLSVSSYIHRIGRAGRAGQQGLALTLVTSDPIETRIWQKVMEHFTISMSDDGEDDEEEQCEGECDIKELPMERDNIRALYYRTNDVLCSITSKAVKEARLNQLKLEMVNSSKLQGHFEDNPRELSLLHDRVLRPSFVKPHLTVIPDYLLPEGAKLVESTPAATRRSKSIAESRSSKRDRFRMKAQKQKNNPLKLNRSAVSQIKKKRSKKSAKKRR